MDEYQQKCLAAGIALGGGMWMVFSILRLRGELDEVRRRACDAYIRPSRVTEVEQELQELKRSSARDRKDRDRLADRVDRRSDRGAR